MKVGWFGWSDDVGQANLLKLNEMQWGHALKSWHSGRFWGKTRIIRIAQSTTSFLR